MNKFNPATFTEYRERMYQMYQGHFFGDEELLGTIADKLACVSLSYSLPDMELWRMQSTGLLATEVDRRPLTDMQIKLKRLLIIRNLAKAGVKLDKQGKQI